MTAYQCPSCDAEIERVAVKLGRCSNEEDCGALLPREFYTRNEIPKRMWPARVAGDGDNTNADAGGDGESLQDRLEAAMPPLPEDAREVDDEAFRMTPDEQADLHGLFESLIQTLYDRGFTPNELGVVVRGFAHRMNAARYDPHEYDRIALTLQLREVIEDWRDAQDHAVPVHEIAETVESLGRLYRTQARKELYTDDGDDD